jgi:hypothetical protein
VENVFSFICSSNNNIERSVTFLDPDIVWSIHYRCEDRKEVGGLKGDIGAIR